MGATETSAELVALAYQAAYTPSLWQEFLARYADAVKGDEAAIMVAPIDGFPLSLLAAHNPVSLTKIAHLAPIYGNETPYLKRALDRGLAPGVFTYGELFSKEELKGWDHYEVYLRASGLEHALQMLLSRGQKSRVAPIYIGVGKNWGREDFSAEDRRLATAILPHLRRITRLCFDANLAAPFDPAIAQAFDQFATPCVLLSVDGEIVYMNAAADRFFGANNGVSIVNKRIRAADAHAQPALASAMQKAVGLEWSWLGRSGADVVLPGDDGCVCVASIMPLGPDNPFVGWVGPVRGAVYFLSTANSASDASRLDRLSSVYGLSPAEARVAAEVILGKPPDQIAKTLGLRVSTVRQYIKQVMAKTGMHRQSEMTRLRALLGGPV